MVLTLKRLTFRLLGQTRRASGCLSVLALLLVPLAQPATAAPEDILAGAFDAVTEVPFATIMLGIVRSGVEGPTTPETLDARLTAVEALLRDMEPRLRLVEQRLLQLQNEVVKVSNINRLRELQRIRSDLADINFELKTKPSDPGRRAILEFRAQQQADLLKNNVDFDIWKWSDVQDDAVRTRFMVYPSYELYSAALATWFAAIEFNSGDRPQRVVFDLGGALLEHANFLESRVGFKDVEDSPISLPEHLRNAAFCRLEAVDRFANSAGQCVFASVCIDTMTDKSAETDRQTFTMRPPTVGTLCTFNPGQSVGLKGEAELRRSYGFELMAALSESLKRLASTGSLGEPFVGTFPNFVMTQIFSVPLDTPLLAPRGAVAGALPAVPTCVLVVSGGCATQVSEQTGWKISSMAPSGGGATGLTEIKNNGSGLCLDVKKGAASAGADVILFPCNRTQSQTWNKRAVNNVRYTLASGSTSLCATVVPALPSRLGIQLKRGLFLQPCDGNALQEFSGSDSSPRGPN
jgi:hypothetical protein